MSQVYYTLFTKRDDKWCIEFGDYDHGTVIAERDDLLDDELRRQQTLIARTLDDQATIERYLDGLNGVKTKVTNKTGKA